MSVIWVTGTGGLIGNHLARLAPRNPQREIRALTRAELDLTDFAAVRNRFHCDRPTLIIHCAGLTRSPDCQANPGLARQLNVEVTALLAELASAIPFIFFSTDLVFDGRSGNYDESAAVNPLSVYAETKVEAERLVLANPIHTVVRTSLNGGASPTGDRGFDEQMRRAWSRGETLKFFTDEFRSPISAEATARATWELAVLNEPGLFHVAGSERISRFRLGQLVAARSAELKPKFIAASLKEYHGPPRPPDTSLNCSKAQRLLSFLLPSATAWLSSR